MRKLIITTKLEELESLENAYKTWQNAHADDEITRNELVNTKVKMLNKIVQLRAELLELVIDSKEKALTKSIF